MGHGKDWPFADGDTPPPLCIKKFLDLVDERFRSDATACIAVHCVAGLGRAPVLVAIALIEAGMEPEEAVEFIRQRRKGAINSKQLKFVQSYRPHRRARKCVIM